MNVRLIREIAQTIVVLVVCIFAVLLLVGCASIPLSHDQCNATKYETAMEHEQCLLAATKYDEEEYARNDARNIRREEVVNFILSCQADPERMLVTYKLSRFEKQALDRAQRLGNLSVHNLPRSVGRANFGCMTYDDVQRALDEIARRGL